MIFDEGLRLDVLAEERIIYVRGRPDALDVLTTDFLIGNRKILWSMQNLAQKQFSAIMLGIVKKFIRRVSLDN